jgi:hypothetical protein
MRIRLLMRRFWLVAAVDVASVAGAATSLAPSTDGATLPFADTAAGLPTAFPPERLPFLERAIR